jgi:hypothetical protein
MYKDGSLSLATTVAADPTINWAGIQNFEIGAFSFDSFWGGGQVDDFAIFDHALSAPEVNTAFTQGIQALVIPEPSALMLVLVGALSIGSLRRTRRV